MIKPNILLNASGRKTSKIAAILPKDGSLDFDFARATSSGYKNTVAEYEIVGPNEPLFTVENVNSCPVINMDIPMTNELTYSETFDTNWSNSRTITVPSGILGPDDTSSMTLLQSSDSTDAEHRVRQTVNMSVSTSYTFSVFVKKGESALFYMRDLSNNNHIIVNLDTQFVLVNTGGYVVEFSNYINDIFRISMTFTTPATITNNRVDIGITSDTLEITSVVPDTWNCYIWGAQLEANAFPTNYISSIGGTQGTRVKSVLSKSAIPIEYLNSEEGCWNLNCSFASNDAGFSISDGSTTNVLSIYIDTTFNKFRIEGRVSNSTVVEMEKVGVELNRFYDITIKWKVNDWGLKVDGVEVDSDLTVGTFPAEILNSINSNFGTIETFKPFSGQIKSLEVFDNPDAYDQF